MKKILSEGRNLSQFAVGCIMFTLKTFKIEVKLFTGQSGIYERCF